MTQEPRQVDQPRRPPTVTRSAMAPPLPQGAPPPPAPPPRPITPRVLRRSWQEPQVRFWWMATLVLLIIGIIFVVRQVMEYRDEQQLTSLPTVKAVITDIEGDSRESRVFPPDTPVTLKLQWNGSETNLSGVLEGQTEFIHPKEVIDLHVNPNDPTEWTDRNTPEPIAQRLFAGLVIVPVVAAAALTALLLRRRAMGLWRDAEPSPYTVVDVRHSALAPLSHTVRCTAVNGDGRLITVYLPSRLPAPASGELLWLLHRRGKPAAAIPAAAYA